MLMLNKLVEQALRKQPELIGLEDVVEKEILHHDIMFILHKEGLLQGLTFIGGTSLRLCYDASRLSEDLDFTAGLNFKSEKFSGLGDELKGYLEKKYGLNVSIYEPRLSKSNTSTWKVTIEKHNDRPDLPSQKMHIDICSIPSFDIEHRPILDHYGIKSQLSGLPIPVQSLTEIMADKMLAFAYRERRIKPRDVWDIIWLKQQRIKQSVELITQKLSVRNKETNDFVSLLTKHKFMILDDSNTKNDFEEEMKRFLPQSIAERTILQPTFWDYAGKVIKEEVEIAIDNLTTTNEAPEFKL